MRALKQPPEWADTAREDVACDGGWTGDHVLRNKDSSTRRTRRRSLRSGSERGAALVEFALIA
ncbi:MAG TPA: hypothetical protein VFU14_05270, partial [Acidimicrobiales bacterium]|nr:hypothetical protein [Acidimicrobiales bacterium]